MAYHTLRLSLLQILMIGLEGKDLIGTRGAKVEIGLT